MSPGSHGSARLLGAAAGQQVSTATAVDAGDDGLGFEHHQSRLSPPVRHLADGRALRACARGGGVPGTQAASLPTRPLPGRPPTRSARRSSTPSGASTSLTGPGSRLYAGSGALGIEALSRGAEHCTFVERDRAALSAIHANIAAFGLTGRTRVVNGDAVRMAAWCRGRPGLRRSALRLRRLARPARRGQRRAPRRRGADRRRRRRHGSRRPLGAGTHEAVRADLGDVPRTGRSNVRAGATARPAPHDRALSGKLRPDPPRPSRRDRAGGRAVRRRRGRRHAQPREDRRRVHRRRARAADRGGGAEAGRRRPLRW